VSPRGERGDNLLPNAPDPPARTTFTIAAYGSASSHSRPSCRTLTEALPRGAEAQRAGVPGRCRIRDGRRRDLTQRFVLVPARLALAAMRWRPMAR
jgi:hypothetical protein